MSKAILIPLLNPNETEALIAGLHIQEGQQVAAGEILCTLETTKSTADLPAEQDGYVIGLRFAEGDTASAGELLCYLAESAEWQPPAAPATTTPTQDAPLQAAAPPGLRITRPALEMAQQAGLDLASLPQDRLLTESFVRDWIAQNSGAMALQPPTSAFDASAVVVYGGGGHGKAVIDLLRALGVYRVIGILDDGIEIGETIMGVPVLGGAEALPELFAQGVRLAINAVGGIGNIAIRIKVFENLAATGFVCPAIIHPSAVVEPSAVLAPGVQVFAQAYVGSEAQLGFGCIVNTGAIVSHDCRLGDYANISPGAILAGEVQVGAAALVGMSATINLRVSIGNYARIGNSATVIRDVPEKGVVRAGQTHPSRPTPASSQE
jgi:sugar O-acyltransferase (sialic acid O-acetyltransferase NeuD family)